MSHGSMTHLFTYTYVLREPQIIFRTLVYLAVYHQLFFDSTRANPDMGKYLLIKKVIKKTLLHNKFIL